MSTLIFICCGFMYWFGLSLDDLCIRAKSKLHEHQLDHQNKIEPKQHPEQPNEIGQIRNYNKMLTEALCKKIGITDETISTINKHYRTLSTGFDRFTDLLATYLAMFRELTKDVIGLKTLYHVYDELCVYATMIETIRQFSNSVNRAPMNHTDNSITPDPDHPMFGGNISPEDQKLIDDMTMKMMSQFDMSEFTKMMEQFQPPSKTSSSSKSSDSNTKKKKKK